MTRREKETKKLQNDMFTYTETWQVHKGTDNRIIFNKTWSYQQPLAMASMYIYVVHKCT